MTMPAANTLANLKRLLRERQEYPDRIEQIDAEILATYGQERAILVTDLCGFSLTTSRYGIIHTLTKIERKQELSRPIFRRHGGDVIKCVADDMFVLFRSVGEAVRAATTLISSLRTINAVLPADEQIHMSIGVGYGLLLLVEQADLWGDEVNLASKLGEDLAGPDEILLSPAAHARLQDESYHLIHHSLEIYGRQLDVYQVIV